MGFTAQDDDFDPVAFANAYKRPATNSAKSLSQSEIEDVLRQAGWPEQHIPKMSAVAMGEGAVDPDDRSRRLVNSFNPGVGPGGVPTKEKSGGLFQINILAHPQYDLETLKKNPVYGAKAALDVFKGSGGSFRPWGAYTNGSWKRYYKGKSISQPEGFDPVAFANSYKQSGETSDAFDPAEYANAYKADIPKTQAPPTEPVQTIPQPTALPTVPQPQTPVMPGVPLPAPNATIAGAPQTAPESLQTLDLQRQQASHPESPRIGTLITQGERPAPLGANEADIPLNDGRIFRADKTKLQSFLASNQATVEDIASGKVPIASLIAKVDDVGNDTGRNQPIIQTKAPDGTPITDSVVTSPASAAKQAAIDKQGAPAGSTSTLTTTDKVVADRNALNIPAPTATPSIDPQMPGAIAGTDTSVRILDDTPDTTPAVRGRERVTFENKPEDISNQDYFIQQVVPRLASQLQANDQDVEDVLRKTLHTVAGKQLSDIQKGEWYDFQMTPEFAQDVASARENRLATAKQKLEESLVIGEGMDAGQQKAAQYGLTSADFQGILQDPTFAQTVEAKKKQYQDALMFYGQEGTTVPADIQARRALGYLDYAGADREVKTRREEDDAYQQWLKETGYDNPEYLKDHQEAFKRDKQAVLSQFGSFKNVLDQATQAKKDAFANPMLYVTGRWGLNATLPDTASTNAFKPTGIRDTVFQTAKERSDQLAKMQETAPTQTAGWSGLLEGGGDFAGWAHTLSKWTGASYIEDAITNQLRKITGQDIFSPTELAQATEMIGKQADDKGWVSAGIKTSFGIGKIVLATAATGNPYTGFALTDAMQASKEGGDAFDVAKASGKGLATAVLFEFAPVLGTAIDSLLKPLFQKMGLPAVERAELMALTPKERAVQITEKLFNQSVRSGTIFAIGAGQTAVEGGDLPQTGESGLSLMLVDFVMSALHRKPTSQDWAKMDGKIVRIPDADGNPQDVIIKVKDGKAYGAVVTDKVPDGIQQVTVFPKPKFQTSPGTDVPRKSAKPIEGKAGDEGAVGEAVPPKVEAGEVAPKVEPVPPVASEAGQTRGEIVDNKGNINYEQLNNDTRRIERGEQTIEQLDPEAESGRTTGGTRNVEASLILAANERSSETTQSGSRSRMEANRDTSAQQEKLLEDYAKKEGIWYHYNKLRNRGAYLDGGKEANVYRNDDGTSVIKVINPRAVNETMTPQRFLDERITLYNHLFPESPYTLRGFTRDLQGKFHFVVEQPFIHGEGLKTQAEVDAAMLARGFEKTGRESYSNKLYQVHDVHIGNVLKDADGNIHVIDAVPKAIQTPKTVLKSAPPPATPVEGREPVAKGAEPVPAEVRAAAEPAEGAAGKEPWQMTQAERIAEQRNQSYIKGDDGKYYASRSNYPYRSEEPVDIKSLDADTKYIHKQKVEQALRDGKPVPPEVLAEYPDLAAKYAESAGEKAAEQAAKPTEKTSGIIAIPRSAAKRYAYGDEVADQIKTPEFRAAEAKASKETPSTRTGFTKTQTEYLAKQLQDYADKYPSDAKYAGKSKDIFESSNFKRSFREEEIKPDIIVVPDDGVFRITDLQQANRLFQRITGKSLKGQPKEKISAKAVVDMNAATRRPNTDDYSTNNQRQNFLIKYDPDEMGEISIPIAEINSRYIGSPKQETNVTPGRIGTGWVETEIGGKKAYTNGMLLLMSDEPFGKGTTLHKPNGDQVIGLLNKNENHNIEPQRATNYSRKSVVTFDNDTLIPFENYALIKAKYPDATFKGASINDPIGIYNGKDIVGVVMPLHGGNIIPDYFGKELSNVPAEPEPQQAAKPTNEALDAKIDTAQRQAAASISPESPIVSMEVAKAEAEKIIQAYEKPSNTPRTAVESAAAGEGRENRQSAANENVESLREPGNKPENARAGVETAGSDKGAARGVPESAGASIESATAATGAEKVALREGDLVKDDIGRKGMIAIDKQGRIYVSQEKTEARLPLSDKWQLRAQRPLEVNGLKNGDVVQKGDQIGRIYEYNGGLRVKWNKDGKVKTESLSERWTKPESTDTKSAPDAFLKEIAKSDRTDIKGEVIDIPDKILPDSRKGERGMALIPTLTQMKELVKSVLHVPARDWYQRIKDPIEKMMAQHRAVRDVEFETERLKRDTERKMAGMSEEERAAIVDAAEHDYKGPLWNALTPEQKNVALGLKPIHDAIEAYNRKYDVFSEKDMEPGLRYIHHQWINPETGRPYATNWGQFAKSGPSSKQRSIETYLEGRTRGENPLEMASTNLGEILGKSFQQIVQVKEARELVDYLKNWTFVDPEGIKLKGIVAQVPKGMEHRYEQLDVPALNPVRYVSQGEGKPGLLIQKPAFIIKELAPKINAYFVDPKWNKFDEFLSAAKAVKLMGSFFHGLGLLEKNTVMLRFRSIHDIKRGLGVMKEMDETSKILHRNGIDTMLDRDYKDIMEASGQFRKSSIIGKVSDIAHKNPMSKLVFGLVRVGLKNAYAHDVYHKMEVEYLAKAEKQIGRPLTPEEVQQTQDIAARAVVKRADSLFSGEDMKMGALEATQAVSKYYFSPAAQKWWSGGLISKTWQREHIIEAKNLTKSLLMPKTMGPIYKEHIKEIVGVAMLMSTASLYNYFVTRWMDGEGHQLWDNPSGSRFSIRAPWNEPDGAAAYIRPFKAITEVPEVIAAAGASLIKGDPGDLIEKLEGKVNSPVTATVNQLGFANEKRKQGIVERAKQLTADLAPIAATIPANVIRGRRTPWDLAPWIMGATMQKQGYAKNPIVEGVRSGKLTEDDAQTIIDKQFDEGKITKAQHQRQLRDMQIDNDTAKAKTLRAIDDFNFDKIDTYLHDIPVTHREGVKEVMLKKLKNIQKDPSEKAQANAQRLEQLIYKYFPEEKPDATPTAPSPPSIPWIPRRKK
jgi:hypothetical protein